MSSAKTDVRIKRPYDAPEGADGYRVLVDRLWPRGVSRESAMIDEWNRELAPSSELRKWFGHDPARFDEFTQRYEAELDAQRPQLAELRKRARKEPVTLIYAAKDAEHNHALVLAGALRHGLPSGARDH